METTNISTEPTKSEVPMIQRIGRVNRVKSQHTPEPWHVCINVNDRNTFAIDWINARARYVADDLLEEDAQRIVSCVNACAGMDNPEEHIKSLKRIQMQFDTLLPQNGILSETNKELRKALDRERAMYSLQSQAMEQLTTQCLRKQALTFVLAFVSALICSSVIYQIVKP